MSTISILHLVALSVIVVTSLAFNQSPTQEGLSKIVNVGVSVWKKTKDMEGTDELHAKDAKFAFMKDQTNSNYLVRLEATKTLLSKISGVISENSEVKNSLVWRTSGDFMGSCFTTNSKGSTVSMTLDNVFFTRIEKEDTTLPPYFEEKRFQLNRIWYAYVQRKKISSETDFTVCKRKADKLKEISCNIEQNMPLKSSLHRIKIHTKIGRTKQILYLEGPYFVTEFKLLQCRK